MHFMRIFSSIFTSFDAAKFSAEICYILQRVKGMIFLYLCDSFSHIGKRDFLDAVN